MSAIANIVAFDGAATPVSHTFLPESVVREGKTITATYKESLVGVPDYAQVRIILRTTRLSTGIKKVTTRVEVPVMESISGQNSAGYTAAPKVAYVDAAEYTHFAADRSSIAGRRLARQLLVNVSGNVSTSVAAATSGPVSEAVDQLLMPT